MKSINLIMCLLLAVFFTANSYSAPKIEMLKRQGHENEIPLLDNRFRIDSNVAEITLIFFREPGAPAVILVRPDGSKYFATEAIRNPNLQWYDEASYDLVTITKPMPGPWQVVGRILPQSRIVVLGEVTLKADKLPPLLFRGETLKITGQVFNDGEPVKSSLFQDVVTLEVDFVSVHELGDENFGASTQEVAKFKDNGQGLDERARDGIFTGEFKLDLPAGHWRPELYIATPLLQRRVVQPSVTLLDVPFSYDLTLAETVPTEHQLVIHIDDKIVKPETVLIQGRIFYPNNEEQGFSLPASSALTRQLAIKNYDWGKYSVELSVFGSNINGREFMATLPDYKFEIDRPVVTVAPEIAQQTPEQLAAVEVLSEPEQKTLSSFAMIALIVGANALILIIGFLLIRKFVQKKAIMPKLNLSFLKKKSADPVAAVQKEKNKPDENGSKNDKTGEILNLSMSDD